MPNNKLIGCVVGLASSWVMAIAPAVQAQVHILDGSMIFENARIFVGDNGETYIWNGSVNPLIIRTSQGGVELNMLVQGILPRLHTPAGHVPSPGDTGEWLTQLTFRGFTALGDPALFVDIPATLQFEVNATDLISEGDYEHYATAPITRTQSGYVLIESSQTIIPTEDRTVTEPDRLFISPLATTPGAPYNFVTMGENYSGTISTTLTGGILDIPDPPGFSNPEFDGLRGNLDVADIENSEVSWVNKTEAKIESSSDDSSQTEADQGDSSSEDDPIAPTEIAGGIAKFIAVRSGNWFELPTSELADVAIAKSLTVSKGTSEIRHDFEMEPTPILVGLVSRVFPGMMGEAQHPASLFTEISALPKIGNPLTRYRVFVGGQLLGEFKPGQPVRFRDFPAQLGKLLVDGRGVRGFSLVQTTLAQPQASKPKAADASEFSICRPKRTPIKLEFSQSVGSFSVK